MKKSATHNDGNVWVVFRWKFRKEFWLSGWNANCSKLFTNFAISWTFLNFKLIFDDHNNGSMVGPIGLHSISWAVRAVTACACHCWTWCFRSMSARSTRRQKIQESTLLTSMASTMSYHRLYVFGSVLAVKLSGFIVCNISYADQ